MAEESRVPTAPIAHPSDRRDRLSSPASFSYVFCSFSLFLRLFASSPFFLLSARRRLSNTLSEPVLESSEVRNLIHCDIRGPSIQAIFLMVIRCWLMAFSSSLETGFVLKVSILLAIRQQHQSDPS